MREVMGDIYIASLWVFVLGMYGVALLGVVREALTQREPGSSLDEAAGLVPLNDALSVSMVAVAALGVTLLVRMGPMSVTGPQGFWWLGLPLDQRSMLRSRYFRLFAVAVVVAIVGFMPLAVAESDDWMSLLTALVMSGLLGAVAFCLAATVQLQRLRARSLKVCLALIVAAPLAILVAALVYASGGNIDPFTKTLQFLPTFWPVLALTGDAPWQIAAPAFVAVALWLSWIGQRLHLFRAEELKEAGNASGYFAASLYFMDFRSAGLALRSGGSGSSRKPLLRLPGITGAFLSATGTAFLRTPGLTSKTIALCLIPAAALSVEGISRNAALSLSVVVCAGIACRLAATAAMPFADQPALESYFALSAQKARRLHLLIPAGYLAVWGAGTFVALAFFVPLGPLLALQIGVAVAGMAGASVRWAFRPVQDLSSPRSVQATALAGLIRGPDAFILGAAPLAGALYAGQASAVLVAVQLAAGVAAVLWATRLPGRRVRFEDLG